jgi:Nucleotide modification associated domain 2/Phage integrase family/Phage integrase, N-terminal SAM-like domain
MARKLEQIIGRGKRTWLVRIYQGRDPGTGTRKYHNQTIHGPFREAQRFLNLGLQQRDITRAPRATAVTLNQLIDEWLAHVAKPRIRTRTFQDYQSLLRLYIRPVLGARSDDPEGVLFRTVAGKTGRLTTLPLSQADASRTIRRRARATGIKIKIGNHTFRATGITAYLKNGGKLEIAQQIAAHESSRTAGLYDRRHDDVNLDEWKRLGFEGRRSSMVTLFSYVVDHDLGFAPNPSSGYCTFDRFLADSRFRGRLDCRDFGSRNIFALVSRKYLYFGENARDLMILPDALVAGLAKQGPGFRRDYPENKLKLLARWFEKNYKSGIHGDPCGNRSVKNLRARRTVEGKTEKVKKHDIRDGC